MGYQFSTLLGVLAAIATSASADICEHRPSSWLSNDGADAATTGSGVVAATGPTPQMAGYYTLTHSVTGATMLASTAAEPSAAGTVGIIAGTGGGWGRSWVRP